MLTGGVRAGSWYLWEENWLKRKLIIISAMLYIIYLYMIYKQCYILYLYICI